MLNALLARAIATTTATTVSNDILQRRRIDFFGFRRSDGEARVCRGGGFVTARVRSTRTTAAAVA